jgi:hypothetical protein
MDSCSSSTCLDFRLATVQLLISHSLAIMIMRDESAGPIEDRSSIFLNPMRTPRQWIYSIKSGPKADKQGPFGRSRSYCATASPILML